MQHIDPEKQALYAFGHIFKTPNALRQHKKRPSKNEKSFDQISIRPIRNLIPLSFWRKLT
jgi:hypothetical protein